MKSTKNDKNIGLYSVTGFGGSRNKHGDWEKFHRVDVVACSEEEAIRLARPNLRAETQQDIYVRLVTPLHPESALAVQYRTIAQLGQEG